MSSNGPLTPDLLAALQQILSNLMDANFAEPFLEPVRWKEWGLFDYPEVIKHPMDLGTMETKLKRGEYQTFEAFRKDMQLVVDNCMTYNDKKSDVYKLAVKLQKGFDKEVSRSPFAGAAGTIAAAPAKSRAPSADEKDKFCKLVFQLRAVDLGRIIELIDELCPQAIERSGKDEIDINVDVIDAASYRKLEALARECASKEKETPATVPVTSTSNKKRKTKGGDDDDDDDDDY